LKKTLFFLILLFVLVSCGKKENIILEKAESVTEKNNFKTFTIDSGAHFCNDNSFVLRSLSELTFTVKFDSSAIYTTADPNNQDDINKLYGFSDNNEQHHLYSARIGWRWSNNALRLFGYVYNAGVKEDKELSTVSIGKENKCSIKINTNSYVFSINGITDSLPRKSLTPKAEGYQLYPYFGGDETAPHKIFIQIKEN
jgi:hypothetical protein